MELESLHISSHPYVFEHNIKDLEYSASIEQHTYWTQLGDHAACSRQDTPMFKGGPRNEVRGQPTNARTPSPTGRQKRRRSPQEQSDPSPRLRRSQRLEDQSSGQDISIGEPSAIGLESTQLAPNNEADAALESIIEGPRSVAESALPEIPSSGTIIVSLNRRPPLEVRTGVSIPRLSVKVIITNSDSSESGDSDTDMDIGTLHAVVSLWSADGRVASPHAVPPMLTGRKDATLANMVSSNTSERQAEATFSDLAITWPGYYRIRISIMETPVPEPDDDGDSSIGSPRQLLSIETRPIHAHGFAPLIRR